MKKEHKDVNEKKTGRTEKCGQNKKKEKKEGGRKEER